MLELYCVSYDNNNYATFCINPMRHVAFVASSAADISESVGSKMWVSIEHLKSILKCSEEHSLKHITEEEFNVLVKMNEQKEIAQEIVKEKVDEALKSQANNFSDETKNLVGQLSENLIADIHNYFVALIENVARPDSGFTAEQLNNASKDLAHILGNITMIIQRHKNFIIHNDPDYDTKKAS